MKKINNNIKIIYVIIICFFIIKFLSDINLIPMITNIIPIIWFGIFIIGIFISYNDYNHFFNVEDKIYTIIIILIICLIFHFLSGLFIGYSYNAYNNNNFGSIFNNFYLYILPIVFQEYIRGILCNYSNNSNKLRIFISILYVLLNINFASIDNIFINNESFLKFICLNVISEISLQFVLTYLASVSSYKTSMIYRLINTCYSVFIPIVPSLHFFLNSIFYTIIPVIIYFVIDYFHEKDISKIYYNRVKKSVIVYIYLFIIIIILAFNYFDLFKYKMVAILSNSMNPLYSKGDVVVYQKLSENEKNNLKIGDIIVFEDKNSNTIIHRIVKIQDSEDIMYITKGDNNDNIDSNLVKLKDIKGKYLIHIKYFGYPKVFMYEVLNN